ncbi:hypothetical protein F3Y22_tig00110377pilonHSYRG00345 [Hibiscus syriacus]|uniref:RNase H type-1 domain-containing protein n=1 Tax=Hibiscus syriacus TaxID=106335 RepID=A0A6A3AVF6_HIBSY|nr:hypothetical protein F3Y22_tig00110377pilonHSYRG00345 [Hibiscus syriacus]
MERSTIYERGKMLQADCNRFKESRTRSKSGGKQHLVQWEALPTEWVNLNIDGVKESTNGYASCRGVIRNSNGEWVLGYSRAISARKVILEIDSKEVYRLLTRKVQGGTSRSILQYIQELMRRTWTILLSLVQRGANMLTDKMAKLVEKR